MAVEPTIAESEKRAASVCQEDPADDHRSDASAIVSSASDSPVIFYDGVCGLCNRWVDFVLARDRARIFRFAPLQGETARARLGIDPSQPLNSVVLVDEAGEHRKSDAICRMLSKLGGKWSLAGLLLRLVPRPLRNGGYDFVARHRYRIFGKKETCRLPTAAERERFLP